MVGTISFCASLLLATLFLHLCFQQEVEAQPGPFINNRLRNAFNVIQAFKRRIQSDPKNYTGTWVGNNVCKYKGFTCAVVPDLKKLTVIGVSFNGALFGGFNNRLPLNGFIDRLEDLVFFHANSNNFTGTVPRGTARHRFFYELDLSNNKLTGGFPNETLGATNLTFLNLSGSTHVDLLFLNNNNFQQRLPANLGSTPAHYLTFANNKFVGSIPRSIRQARNTLYEVLFLGNRLSGCLPYEIGFLKQATVFDVSSNILTGPIPNSFACLGKLEYLSLATNQFYGRLPEAVCRLRNLERFSAANNYFSRIGPTFKALITKKILDVRGNCIPGLPNQKTAAQCAAFFSIPRTCPRPRTLSIIPCRRSPSALNETNADINEEQLTTKAYNIQAPAEAPRTYATLMPHGH
ncbi:uncharacterized protein Pyn_29957 [Prunus yedoensis var. nudiflora]|uniref:Leucine-rich repeat-containing N-terminal plant-type domain-containing protein n=1 Tax=Prunus yedoensis var. nudiflora TaxID=2094558 RepID=A0A314Z9P6_PRUYE|nr:uncharacterized protein Pyn_29957 [Prunus yedoensis var. nudiflora]